MSEAYKPPSIRIVGSVYDLTKDTPNFNKKGSHADQYTAAIENAIGINIIGSVVSP